GAGLVETGESGGTVPGQGGCRVADLYIPLGHVGAVEGHLGQVDAGERLELARVQRLGDDGGNDRAARGGVDLQAQVGDGQVEQSAVAAEGDGAGVGDQGAAVGGVPGAGTGGEGEGLTVEGDAAVRADVTLRDRALDVGEEGLLQ